MELNNKELALVIKAIGEYEENRYVSKDRTWQEIVNNLTNKLYKESRKRKRLRRVTLLSKKPVMKLPNYEFGIQAEGRQGCAQKPMRD